MTVRKIYQTLQAPNFFELTNERLGNIYLCQKIDDKNFTIANKQEEVLASVSMPSTSDIRITVNSREFEEIIEDVAKQYDGHPAVKGNCEIDISCKYPKDYMFKHS